MSPDAVLDAALRDAPFHRRSGGGVTFSGGEPFQQPDFLAKCASLCASAGIAVAVETCGFFSWDSAVAALADIDLVLLDIKHMNPGIHRRLTGMPNDIILENACRLSRAGMPLLVRTPLIPGCTDDPANVEAIRDFVRSELPTAVGHETLPYHELGKGKYTALGRKYPIAK
jgi:pyruvate formate lyase activating enzyme